MTIFEACGDTVRRAGDRDESAPAGVLRHALAVGAEMESEISRNKLYRAEGALKNDNGFRPLYA